MHLDNILKAISFSITYILPILAFWISVVSLIKSFKSQELQDRINTLELKIKLYDVEELEIKKNESKANVEARLVKIGTGNYKLKVWNAGMEPANKVNVIVESGASITLLESNILPYESLEKSKSFEIVVLINCSTESKFKVMTTWYDKDGKYNNKENICTI